MVNFIEVFMCGVGAMFGEEEYVAWGVAILVRAKEGFFRLPCVFQVGVALPVAKLHVFQFGNYVGVCLLTCSDATYGVYDVGLGVRIGFWRGVLVGDGVV